jgi:hypothetical protein
MNRRLRAVFVALVAFAGVAALTLLAWKVADLHTFHEESLASRDQIRTLKGRVPPGLDPVGWDDAVEWCANACGNTFVTPGPETRPAVVRFRRALETKLAEGPVGPETLRWIWEEVGRSCPPGRWYADEFRERFEEAMARATEPTR